MGSLSEYINGYRGGRSVYNYDSPRFNSRTGSLNKGGDNGAPVQVFGVNINLEMLGRIMTSDPYMAANMRKLIRQVLREARKRVSDDIKGYLKEDPRKAARAVKYAVYKSMFGGNISILQKKSGTAGPRYKLVRQNKLQPGQRGGNRRLRSDDSRNRLDTYFGADRGFILRFISSGTVRRQTRYGNRGSIAQTDMFGRIAPWQMQAAAQDVADNITEYINHEANG